jgi:Glyoxalase/Bleomycin resistance protein/Dioxygenase superfamily
VTNTDQSGRCISVAPIMPTTDTARTRQHYARLGFSAEVIDNFMMTKRDDIELFFSLTPEHDPKRTASCIYVRVADAEALHALWQAASIPGVRQLRNTNYKMREFAYVDPDGNMILFGSRLPDNG